MAILVVDPKKYPKSKTSGIQETLDQIPEEGGTVFIPAGKYEIRRTLFPNHKTTMTGEGPATVLQRPSPVICKLKKDYDAKSLCVVTEKQLPLTEGDFFLVYDFKNGGYNTQCLCVKKNEAGTIHCEKINGKDLTYTLEDDAMARNSFPGIWVRNKYAVVLENFTIDGGDFNLSEEEWRPDFADSAVDVDQSTHVMVRNLRILKWPADGITVGKMPTGFPGAEKMMGEAIFSGNIVEDCLGIGLHAGAFFENSIWVNNWSMRNGHGFLFCRGVSSTLVANNVISYNRRNGMWGLGDPDQYNIVQGNVCVGNGFYGLEAATGIGNVINSNIFRDNSKAQPGMFSGILLKETKNTVVVGNLCTDIQERHTQTHGIEVDNPLGPTLVESNLCSEFSSHWKIWEELEKKRALYAAKKASSDKR